MKKIIAELRLRGVFRAAGLYIALTWLLLQLADVVFPAFDIPDSALRYILIGAIGGFPVAMIVSWFYDITAEGIRSEAEVREAGERRSRGLASLLTIVLLVLALAVSLFANYRQAQDTVASAPALVSILVADFINQTGDDIFDGSLETALAVGIEGAPFISSFARHRALAIARDENGASGLDEENARLVAIREGIQLIVAGSIRPDGAGYSFSLQAINPLDGEVRSDAEADAGHKSDVLAAVGRLALQIRQGLGDASAAEGDPGAVETFSAASLEAARAYTLAQAYARQGQDEQAVEYYTKAINEDPGLGRAYSGWALSAARLGRIKQSEELWQKTLPLLDGMTERERYRTLGIYYAQASANYEKAIENFRLLIEKYPADTSARNNLAVSYFYTRQFDQALALGASLAEEYPSDAIYRANYALYAMYAGDFDTARREAELVLKKTPDYFQAYVPLAMADLAQGNTAAAQKIYQKMAMRGPRASSLASTGMADIALLQGDFAAAIGLLESGRAADIESGNDQAATHKAVYRAIALYGRNDNAAALAAVAELVPGTQSVAHLLPAGRLLVQLGDMAQARGIQQALAGKLQQTSRAAADLLAGEIALAEGDPIAAVDALSASIARQDSWLARLVLGRVYVKAGYLVEALGEFEQSEDRIGEAAALFLDDTPTFQNSAPLYYWLANTKQQLGMRKEAAMDYQRYLALRVAADDSPMTREARAMLAKLATGPTP